MNMFTAAAMGVILFAAAAATADSTTYVIDGTHTHIPWEVDRFGFAKTMGSFTDVAGEITVRNGDVAQSAVAATIALAGLRSDSQEREDVIRGEHWLQADAFGTIHFRSTSVERTSADDEPVALRVSGVMTMLGIERPLALDVRINKTGIEPVTRRAAIGFSADGQFRRSDFRIDIAQGLVGDLVTFRIEGVAIAPPDASKDDG